MKISSAAPSTAAGTRNRRLNRRSPSGAPGAPDDPDPDELAAPRSLIAIELRLAPASAPWRSSVPDMRVGATPAAHHTANPVAVQAGVLQAPGNCAMFRAPCEAHAPPSCS